MEADKETVIEKKATFCRLKAANLIIMSVICEPSRPDTGLSIVNQEFRPAAEYQTR